MKKNDEPIQAIAATMCSQRSSRLPHSQTKLSTADPSEIFPPILAMPGRLYARRIPCQFSNFS